MKKRIRITISLSFLISVFLSCATQEVRQFPDAGANREALNLIYAGEFQKAFDVSENRLKEAGNDADTLALNSLACYILTIMDINRTMRRVDQMRGGVDVNILYSMFDRSRNNFLKIHKNLSLLQQAGDYKFIFSPGKIRADWDGNGYISEQENNFLSVETSGDGRRIYPYSQEFAFDNSDILWAASYISFHVAFMDVISCFDYKDIFYLVNKL